MIELDRTEPIRLKKGDRHTIEAVVDRLVARDGIRVRLADSIETALKWGSNRIVALCQTPTADDNWAEYRYSTDYGNAETGFNLGELTPRHFSFNSHLGACPACHGLGTQLVIDPELMISDPTKSLAEGAIIPWRRGTNGDPIEMQFGGKAEKKTAKPFEGLVPQMQRLYEQTESEFTRNRIRAFMTRETCKVCGGARLKPEILAVTIKARDGRELNIHQFSQQNVEDALRFIGGLDLTEQQQTIVTDVVREIRSRLQFLVEVGLGYLTLNRESGTLSGGEAQRIRLATQIGSGLAGVLYILDEPSIGLHQRDNSRLLGTLR